MANFQNNLESDSPLDTMIGAKRGQGGDSPPSSEGENDFFGDFYGIHSTLLNRILAPSSEESAPRRKTSSATPVSYFQKFRPCAYALNT